MADPPPIIFFVAAASAAAYYLYTRPSTPQRVNFFNPGKDISKYDPTLIISGYDYHNNKNAENAFWINQYARTDGRLSAPPAY